MKLKNVLKNQLLIALSFLFRKKREKPKDWSKARFLIISTTALGDTLWATPALSSLRSSYPDAFITVLTSKIGYEILKNESCIDELYLLPKKLLFSFLPLRKKLARQKFDAVLIFHASQRLVFPLAASIGASEIIGTQGINKDLDFFLTDPLPQQKCHEIERRLAIIAKVGAKTTTKRLFYTSTPEEMQKAGGLLKRYGLTQDQKIIALHPGAKDSYKCWSKQNFIELGKLLKKNTNAQLIVTGGPDEKELTAEIASGIPGALSFAEPLPFRIFAAFLQKMNLLIVNDTGPMHLAAATNTPVVALFAPTDPAICGPLQAEKALVIHKPRTCTPCLRRKCRDPFCLLQIVPQEVCEAALKLL